MEHVTDFFDQLSGLWQEILKLINGIKNTTDINGVYDKFEEYSRTVQTWIGHYVHPMFIPYITFAIVIAMAHKFFRFGDKQ